MMKGLATLPYYFPTTVILVDNNEDFLINFSLQLDPNLAYRLFTSPADALAYINEPNQAQPLYERWFSEQGGQASSITLDLSMIVGELYSEQRFSEVSVVVVDYDMPHVNGLELCRRIESPHIKKILFTGKADEKTAVRAFNEGTIDRFLAKNEPSLAQSLEVYIEELQTAYFRDASETAVRGLEARGPAFLRDPELAYFFSAVRREHRLVEYYLTLNPPGFVCLSADGRPYLLLLRDAGDMQRQYRVAHERRAPQALLDLLKSGEVIPYFPDGDGCYQSGDTDWARHLHLAESVRCATEYLYVLLPDPAAFRVGPGEILSYNYYLEVLDRLGRGTLPL
jgi:CheY-like chemotaxis protein